MFDVGCSSSSSRSRSPLFAKLGREHLPREFGEGAVRAGGEFFQYLLGEAVKRAKKLSVIS